MSQKLLFLLTVNLLAIAHTSLAQSCPPTELLAPCKCVQEILRVECDFMTDLELKQVFDRVSPIVPDDVIFEHLRVWFLNSTEIGPDTMTYLKFRNITIEYSDVELIHPDAFNATYEITTNLRIQSNKLSDPSNFNFFNRFKNLEELSLNENYLAEIPSDPFELLPNLRRLWIGSCGLVEIGSRIFANLPALQNAYIRSCNMTLAGFALDAFEGIGPSVVLDLQNNKQVRGLPEPVFRPVLDSAAGLEVGGRECIIIGVCYDITMNCSDEVAWLCRNQSAYEPKLSGYLCHDRGEEEGYDVWDWCRDNAIP